MAEPFQARDANERGLLKRVAGRMTRQAAVHELETLLAEADCVRDVTLENLRRLGERHGVDLECQLLTLRRTLYRRFLEHCLLDYSLSETEVEDLEHLRRLLHLADEDVAHLQDQVSRQVYGAAVEDVLADHRLDEEEESFLRRLRQDLDLAEYHADRIYGEGFRRAQQRLLSRSAITSSFLAPDGAVVELSGSSPRGIEGAIQAAVDESAQALPHLAWARLADLRIQVESGRVVSWRVTLEAGMEGSADG